QGLQRFRVSSSYAEYTARSKYIYGILQSDGPVYNDIGIARLEQIFESCWNCLWLINLRYSESVWSGIITADIGWSGGGNLRSPRGLSGTINVKLNLLKIS